jgi:hypothetical protein
MARASAVTSFLDGFNAGWDTVGKVGTAYGLKKLDKEEERITEGLKADPESGKYSIFGMNFDEAPNQYQISEARNMAQAKVYDKYGDSEAARGLRSDAQTSRQAGLTFKTGQQTYDQNEKLNPLKVESERLGIDNKKLLGEERRAKIAFDAKNNPNLLTKNKNDANLSGLNVTAKEASNAFNAKNNPLLLQNNQNNADLSGLNVDAKNAEIEYNEKIRPLQLEYERLRNAGLEGTQRATDLANQIREMDIALREKTDAIDIKQKQLNLDTGTLAKEFNEKTFDANVAKVISESAFATQTLEPKIAQAFANSDLSVLNTEYAKASFDTNLDALKVSLGISKENLNQMIKENPVRLQGLIDSNILNALNIDEKTLNNQQKSQIDGINQSYYDALIKGDFSGVEQNLMPFAAQVYNDNNVADDGNKAIQGEDGTFYIVGPDGGRIGAASDILQSMPMDQKRDMIRQAQAYAVAAITGDNTQITQLFKTEAWLDYYQAQTAALEKGKSLTKAQWAIQRFQSNPQDKLAIAILAGDNAEAVMEQMNDPAYQLKGIGDGSGSANRPGEKNGGGSSNGETDQGSTLGADLLTSLGGGDLNSLLTKLNMPSPSGGKSGGLAAAAANKSKLKALTENVGALNQAISTLETQLESANAEEPKFGKGLVGQNSRKTKLTTLLSQLIDQRRKLNQN